MKALTLTQPWASLVALGHKRIETRSWSTSYRGPLAIHAAKGWPQSAVDLCFEEPFRALLPWRSIQPPAHPDSQNLKLPTGMVVAICRLHEITRTEEAWRFLSEQEKKLGDYSEGRFAWQLADIEPLAEPIPAVGHLRLWEWTP